MCHVYDRKNIEKKRIPLNLFTNHTRFPEKCFKLKQFIGLSNFYSTITLLLKHMAESKKQLENRTLMNMRLCVLSICDQFVIIPQLFHYNFQHRVLWENLSQLVCMWTIFLDFSHSFLVKQTHWYEKCTINIRKAQLNCEIK